MNEHMLDEDRYVYVLSDPRTGEARYVGETHNPARRHAQHANGTATMRTWAWSRELRVKGLRPLMRVVETCRSRMESRAAEREWIRGLSASGAHLLNRRMATSS